MSHFAKNQWYAAAWLTEIEDKPFARRILDQPLVFFRQANGAVAALTDRCPHRLVPLSLGVVVDGNIRCGYHGMQFNGSGQCVHIPAQTLIPPKARTPSFPVCERYGLAWVWMGDPALADDAKVPVLEGYGQPGWEVMDGGYQHHPSNYLNIVENLMDPSHTTFVHKQTIADPAAEEEPVQTERSDTHVVAYKWMRNSPASQNDRRIHDWGDQLVDRGQFFYFFPPSVSRVDITVRPAEADKGGAGPHLQTHSYKFLTPEGPNATHFFWLHVRNYKLGDQAWGERLRGILDFTYLEDRDIEMAMQRSQEETGVRSFAALELDRAPMMAVKMIQKLIAAEAAESDGAKPDAQA